MWKRNGIAAFMTQRMLARCAAIRHAAILSAPDEEHVLAQVRGFIAELSMALRLELLPRSCGALAADSPRQVCEGLEELERLARDTDVPNRKLLGICREVFALACERCGSDRPSGSVPASLQGFDAAETSAHEPTPTVH